MQNSHEHGASLRRLSRRQFLGRLGAGAGAAVASGTGLLSAAGKAAAEEGTGAENFAPTGRFSRMFPQLPPFLPNSAPLQAALMDIAKPGGLLDARDDLAAGPALLITDPALSANNPNNATHTAGTTFLGQFIDHDMTFDIGSQMGTPVAPEQSLNGRTAVLDLDSVYGSGPVASPELYDPADRAKFRLESGGVFEDLPRAPDGTAFVSDPRNDENLIISGLQCAFLLFHNRVVDHLRASGAIARGTDPTSAVAQARQVVTWHYHWIVLKELLPLFVGQPRADNVLKRGRAFYRPAMGQATIPVEFQGAAYRMGHSMIRPSYRANLKGDKGGPFFAMLFDSARSDDDNPDDLSGGHRAARRFIGWQTFFNFGDGEVKPNKLIDTKLSTPLFALPLRAIASHDTPVVLPQRTLLRGVTWSLPSGQAIARVMGVPELSAGDLGELNRYGLGLDRTTPLFYYVLKEAELIENGVRLGPVGGRIVAEVIIGLLKSDPASYHVVAPTWKPTLPTRTGAVTGDFRMVDLLSFARVDPASRGQ